MQRLEHLTDYYPFDSAIVESIAEAAEQQDAVPYEKLAEQYTIDEALKTFVPKYAKKPIQTLEFTPDGDYDETIARVYHLPMANALGPNMIMRGMRLFAADPTERLILQSNPSSPGLPAGKVSLVESARTWHYKNLAPFVDPLLQHLHDEGITKVKHMGYSYGADKALAAVGRATFYDQEAGQAVYAEPVSVAKRSMLSLALAFGKSNGPLQDYIAQSGSESYQAERDKENFVGLLGYGASLMRASNLAIAKTLATSSFQKRVEQTQLTQDTRTAIAWGTESELVPADAMTAVVSKLKAKSFALVEEIRLRGMHHAGGDDINLHAAIMLQGLQDTNPPAPSASRH